MSLFTPPTMRQVQIQLLAEDLPQATLTLAEFGRFDPDSETLDATQLPGVPGEEFRHLYQQAHTRLEKVQQHLSWQAPLQPGDIRVVPERELRALNEQLGQAWQACSDTEEKLHHINEQEREIRQMEQALENFAALSVDLGLLQRDKHFLNTRLGTVPRDNVQRLQEALSLAGHLLFSFHENGDQADVIVVGPKGGEAEQVHSLLERAGFHSLPVPTELRDEPAQLKKELIQRRERLLRERAALEQVIAGQRDSYAELLHRARWLLILAAPYVELDGAVRNAGELAVISGWVPTRHMGDLEQTLEQRLPNPFHLSHRRPRRSEWRQVPSEVRQKGFLSPFATLVKQYGIPRYGEVDPSVVFALTFVLMFGMMFGDIGHGAVILAAALVYRKRLGRFSLFAGAAGLSSMLFGGLYGSIFGYEEVLHPLWMAPLSDPLLMLGLALAWGIAYILVMNLLAMHNRLVEGDLAAALLDTNGLAGIGLYLGLIWGAYNAFNGEGYGLLAGILTMISLGLLMAFKWAENEAAVGERILVVLIESFEAIMGSVSNTLSFLRVAAFSLNHVALAIAVFSLANMMDTTGHWLMVIGGNIFILVLEGAIVTIQTLRLEYFEGFSRFYSGDGREFRPLRLATGDGP